MTDGPFVIAAGRVVDGHGSLAEVDGVWSSLRNGGALCVELTIDPLSAGWHTPVEPNHFRSGNGPIEALAHARDLLCEGRADAVLIRGRDHLRSEYSKEERQRLMAIYGPACSIPEAYTRLARAFMQLHDIDEVRFRHLAELLFENYRRTAARLDPSNTPSPHAFRTATDLFRVADCANPITDFEGAMILGRTTAGSRITLLGVAVESVAGDGPAHIDEIVHYDHLANACRDACRQAQFDLSDQFRAGRCLLEAYTCFPVVPLAFLLTCGIASTIDEIELLLADKEVTVTGGMNLARAAWNNPALNALIAMYERLAAGDAALGAVHGNGGLGYRQGLAILGA